MRAALYARFSSDLQNAGSIGDQLAAARRHAERLGAVVVAEYSDAAISGASMANRPGLNDLMAAAKRGGFDIVIAEALDRLTRSGGDAWNIFEDLKSYGVGIVTISEGEVGELHVGLKGTMNALFLRELGIKVKRGLEGVVRDGRHTATPPYGYRRKLAYDARGEPIRGLIEIVDDEAEVVRRIVREFLAGSTGHGIVHRLNSEGVKGPGGRTWDYGNVVGRPGELRGVLRNPLYAGELVWNRESVRKDRRTGKTRRIPNDPSKWVRHAVPDLAIVDPETWAATQALLAERSAAVAALGNPAAANQPRRLLSGLLRCGVCGGPLNTSGPNRGYRCLTRMRQGAHACSNARTATASRVEAQVLDYVRQDLLHPDVVEAYVLEYHAARAGAATAARSQRDGLERELGEVRRRADRLVDQVADGVLSGRAVQDKLAELERRRAQIEAELSRERSTAEILTVHPKAAGFYRDLVAELQAKLESLDSSAEADAARQALRRIVRQVRVMPGAGRGEWTLEIDADLTALFGLPRENLPQRSAAAGD